MIGSTVWCEVPQRLDGGTARLVQLLHCCHVCVVVPEKARDNLPNCLPPGWCVADILTAMGFGVPVRRADENLLKMRVIEALEDCVDKGLPGVWSCEVFCRD